MIWEVLKGMIESPGVSGNATVKVYNDTGDVIDDVISVDTDEDGVVQIHFTTA